MQRIIRRDFNSETVQNMRWGTKSIRPLHKKPFKKLDETLLTKQKKFPVNLIRNPQKSLFYVGATNGLKPHEKNSVLNIKIILVL